MEKEGRKKGETGRETEKRQKAMDKEVGRDGKRLKSGERGGDMEIEE